MQLSLLQNDEVDTEAAAEAQAEVDDRLGEAYGQRTAAADRRQEGITLTPEWLVEAMLDRLALRGHFDTIVDAGAGSGRFALAAARRFPHARVVAVERNAAMLDLLRRNVAQRGLASQVHAVAGDFLELPLDALGRVAFIGNPPYVRHHDITAEGKRRYAQGMQALGIKASQLAGLHAHFLLRIAQSMKGGDVLTLVTAAEWLDNGYGSAIRALLTRTPLSLTQLWLVPSQEPIFPDALVSAVVIEAQCSASAPAGAEAGAAKPATLGRLSARSFQPTQQLETSDLAARERWTEACLVADKPATWSAHGAGPTSASPSVPLGALFKVTRGQVTGMNAAWVLPPASHELPPEYLVPAVTRAREIIDGTVEAPDALAQLRCVADLPDDLGQVPAHAKALVQRFVERARQLGAFDSFIARQRRQRHRVGMRAPPELLVSYMGRRPPVFRANPHRVSFLNIAHGLYARHDYPAALLRAIAEHLNRTVSIQDGRVYGGGMAKFEPSDVARIGVPRDLVADWV